MKYIKKGIKFQNTYEPSERCTKSTWKGGAFFIGGGYIWNDVLGEAAGRNVIVVGGGTSVRITFHSPTVLGLINSQSVGCIGGWMQGGGHGPAVHDFGLGADQVLEAQVVLADGRLVTADPCQNPDLFFAIRGGGGSTYGVVVTTVVKAHPTTSIAVQQLSFAPLAPSEVPVFMSALQIIHQAYPDLSDVGFSGYGSWYVSYYAPVVLNSTTGFTHTIAVFGKSAKTAELHFAPVAAKLAYLNKNNSLIINETYSSFPTYASYYSALSNISMPAGAYPALGSRLLDRNALASNPGRLASTLQTLAGKPGGFTSTNIVFVGGGQVFRDAEDPYSGVNPAWRKSYVHNIVARGWAPGTDQATIDAIRKDITEVKVQAMKDLAPETGCYMNEADRYDPEFLEDFYGGHLDRLEEVKRKYDPEGVFYCPTCVGSERWREGDRGKLCRV